MQTRMFLRKVLVIFFAGLSFSVYGQKNPTKPQKGESMMLSWPDSENWSLGSNQSGKRINLIELVHKPETVDNWTEMATMMSIIGAPRGPMHLSANGIFLEAKKKLPLAKMTVLGYDDKAAFPWILFVIEAGPSWNNAQGESQIYYNVRGKKSLYVNFWSVKAATITEAQRQKWGAFFKTGRVVEN